MQVVYHHIRHPDAPTRGLTIAAECEITGEKRNTTITVHSFATALCGPKDMFCRKTGRIKAAGRLKSDTYRAECAPPILFRDLIEHLEFQYAALIGRELSTNI